MTRSRENKGSSSLRQRNAIKFFGTLFDSYKFHAQTNLFEHISTKHIIYNVMIDHLTGFLNKCVLAFKRDNHPKTSSSVKQKTQRPSALVFSVSRMTSFLVIIPYIPPWYLKLLFYTITWSKFSICNCSPIYPEFFGPGIIDQIWL